MLYPKIKLGEYKGSTIDKIPMDYLTWLFPGLTRTQDDQHLYYAILYYFLTQGVKVVEKDDKGYFYFTDYDYVRPPGVDNHFLVSNWYGTDSNNNKVYEIIFFDSMFFITRSGNKYIISNKYVSHKYLYGGETMVYEKNDEYYFYDPFGNIINGAFLMRKPYILDENLNKFSGNIKHTNETSII